MHDRFDLAALVAAHERIASFQEASNWAAHARLEVERLESVVAAGDEQLADVHKESIEASAESAQRPWWRRLFRTQRQKELGRRTKRADREQRAAKAAQDRLHELRSAIPTNDAERKALLAPLNAARKELQLDKRELAEKMRDIRSRASREASRVSTRGQEYKGEAADNRRRIRESKESALSSQESKRARIERRLSEVERAITRLEAMR